MEAFTDYDLDPPKPRTKLVTRQGNRVYVVKWTSELPRPEPTQEAGDRPPGDAEGGPQLIYTKEQLPLLIPPRSSPPDTSQGGTATGKRWSRGVGGGDGPNDEPGPHHRGRAGDRTPNTQRVAGPSHPTADCGAPKLGRNAQRCCPTAGAAARRPHARRGPAPRDHHEAQLPARPATSTSHRRCMSERRGSTQ
jgi:hypothetical protein